MKGRTRIREEEVYAVQCSAAEREKCPSGWRDAEEGEKKKELVCKERGFHVERERVLRPVHSVPDNIRTNTMYRSLWPIVEFNGQNAFFVPNRMRGGKVQAGGKISPPPSPSPSFPISSGFHLALLPMQYPPPLLPPFRCG